MLYCNRIIIERKILHQLPTQHDYQSYINGWLCIHHIHEIQIKLASLDSFKKFSYIIVVPCFYNFDCWFTFMEWPIKLFNVSALIFVVNTIFKCLILVFLYGMDINQSLHLYRRTSNWQICPLKETTIKNKDPETTFIMVRQWKNISNNAIFSIWCSHIFHLTRNHKSQNK